MSRGHDDDPPPARAVWDLVRRDEPEPRAIRTAYRRFVTRRSEPLSAFVLVRWLAAGFALGWGVAFAATGDPLFGAGLQRPAQPTVAPRATASRTLPHSRPRPHEAASASASSPADSVAPVPKAPSVNAHAASSAPRVALDESLSDPKWQRAAAALKARNYEAAESALREVEASGRVSDRDAASLALAQVLLTRGRRVEARARLQRLSAQASSPLVREQATALELQAFSSGGRSAAAFPVPE